MRFWAAIRAYDEMDQAVRCKKWPDGHFMCKKGDNSSTNDRGSLWLYLEEEWEFASEHLDRLIESGKIRAEYGSIDSVMVNVSGTDFISDSQS